MIGRLLYLEREEGRRRFPYKANSEPISSHILSGDSCPLPPFLLSPFPPLCVAFVLPFIFILLKAKEGERERGKKTRSTKVVLPAVAVGGASGCGSGGRGWGVQIALQKTGLKVEISHNAADKEVGHITFGGHVTGMQMADGAATGRKVVPQPPRALEG